MTFKFEDDRLVVDLKSDVMDQIVLAGLDEARGLLVSSIKDNVERCSDGVIEKHIWDNLQDNFRFLQAFNAVIEYYGG